jgi:DNA replication protein DnaC
LGGFDLAFETIIEKAKETANIVEGDYLAEDNLYYCGKCHTRKQTVVTLFGDTKVVPCICECKAAEIKAEDDARKHSELVLRLRKQGLPERQMLEWTFANDDGANPKMTNAMKNYVEHFDTFKEQGKGLLLFGDVGTGKTYLAVCVANELINKGIPCLVTSFMRIANELWDVDDKQKYYDNLNSFPLLVIDDLNAERKTEFMKEIVFNVLDMRAQSHKPLIVTTNLTRDELLSPANISDKRIFSRLFELCTPIEVVGKDRRQQALRDDIGKMKNLLGLE